MKKAVLFLISTIFLTSCSNIHFYSPISLYPKASTIVSTENLYLVTEENRLLLLEQEWKRKTDLKRLEDHENVSDIMALSIPSTLTNL